MFRWALDQEKYPHRPQRREGDVKMEAEIGLSVTTSLALPKAGRD